MYVILHILILFGEAGTIVFFFLNIGTYLHLISKENPKTKDFVYFFIASGGFLTAKSQNVPLLVFMLIIYGSLYIYYKEKKQRKNIIIGSLIVVIICTASLISLTSTMNENNIYQSVFSGILRGSKTQEKDLSELGINNKFIKYYGHSFYIKDKGLDPVGEEMLNEFYPKVSNVKILLFYFKHLDRLWQKIVEASNNAYYFSDINSGNFIEGQYNRSKLVNDFRVKLVLYFKKEPIISNNAYMYILFSVAFLAVILFYLIKYKEKNIRLLNLMLLFILATASSQLVLPEIGSGHGDLGKHLFLLNLGFDNMLGIALLWCLHIIVKVIHLRDVQKNNNLVC